MSTVFRTTISISAELKARMDAVTEQVNWSAVAARAFEARLREIEARSKRSMSRNEVIRRMKAVKEVAGSEEREEGKAAGRIWAEGIATPKQLQRLQALAEDPRGIEGTIVLFYNSTRRNPAWGLYQCLQGQHRDFDRAEVEEFWESALGIEDKDRIEDEDFACGFVEGALEIWQDVKDEL